MVVNDAMSASCRVCYSLYIVGRFLLRSHFSMSNTLPTYTYTDMEQICWTHPLTILARALLRRLQNIVVACEFLSIACGIRDTFQQIQDTYTRTAHPHPAMMTIALSGPGKRTSLIFRRNCANSTAQNCKQRGCAKRKGSWPRIESGTQPKNITWVRIKWQWANENSPINSNWCRSNTKSPYVYQKTSAPTQCDPQKCDPLFFHVAHSPSKKRKHSQDLCLYPINSGFCQEQFSRPHFLNWLMLSTNSFGCINDA